MMMMMKIQSHMCMSAIYTVYGVVRTPLLYSLALKNTHVLFI